MSDIESQIRERISEFVNDLSELVRQAALESVSEALGSGSLSVSPAAPRSRAGARGGGPKRTPDEVQEAAREVAQFVAENPGLGVEEIARRLDTTTKELALPIRKLVGSGELVTEGQKRATRYYPPGAAADEDGAKPSKKRASKKRASKKRSSKKRASKKRSSKKKR